MARSGIQRAFPAAAVGLAVVLNGIVLRLVLRADEASVYVLGAPLGWVCALKRNTGLPCPTCGMTRSVLLSLQGEFGRAWRMAPGGPVLVWGGILFAAAMLALAVVQGLGTGRLEPAIKASIRRGLWIYAALGIVVWLGGWVAGVEAALHHS